MSFVTTRPDSIGETAANLHEIGVTMSAHDDGVTPLITNVESPAHDLVSIVTSILFSMHGELYKAIARQAHVIHESFVQTLQTSKTSYWLTELANRAGTST